MGQSTTYHCDKCKKTCSNFELTKMYVDVGIIKGPLKHGEGIRFKEVCKECKKKIAKLISDLLNKNFGHIYIDDCDE